MNGAKSRSTGQNIASYSRLTAAASDVNFLAMDTGTKVDDATLILLSAGNGSIYGDEAAFGLLDPFNFMGNAIENSDWTIFHEQIL